MAYQILRLAYVKSEYTRLGIAGSVVIVVVLKYYRNILLIYVYVVFVCIYFFSLDDPQAKRSEAERKNELSGASRRLVAAVAAICNLNLLLFNIIYYFFEGFYLICLAFFP